MSESMGSPSNSNSIALALPTERAEDETTDLRHRITALHSQIDAIKQDLERSKQQYEKWKEEFGDFVSERASLSLTSDHADHHSIVDSSVISNSISNLIPHLSAELDAVELQVALVQSAEDQPQQSNVNAASDEVTMHGGVACEVPLPASPLAWDESTHQQDLDLAENATLADEGAQPEGEIQAELSKDPEQEHVPGQSNTNASMVEDIQLPSSISCAASASPRLNEAPRAGRAISLLVVRAGIATPQFIPTPQFYEGFPLELFSAAEWLRSASPDSERRRPLSPDNETTMRRIESWRGRVVPGYL